MSLVRPNIPDDLKIHGQGTQIVPPMKWFFRRSRPTAGVNLAHRDAIDPDQFLD